MNDQKTETLKDLFIELAEKRGLSEDALKESMTDRNRLDAWIKAGELPLATFSATIGLSEDKVRELLERDFDKLVPRVH